MACALQELASAEEGALAGSDAPDAVAPSVAASADVATSKAAATALPDSDDESEEDSAESTAASSTADESSRGAIEPASASESSAQQPKVDSMAQTASKAATTALPDSDSDADEDLESQASASMPAGPAQGARVAQPGFGQPAWGALSSQAAESSAPSRRPLGRLDSLSASETDSAEVQSHPDRARQPSLQPAQEHKPAASPWLGSFGQPSTPPFGHAPSASAAPAVPLAISPALGMSRQRSSALPEAGFGQPAPARQPSGSLPPFPSLEPRPAQVSMPSAVFSCMRGQSAAAILVAC